MTHPSTKGAGAPGVWFKTRHDGTKIERIETVSSTPQYVVLSTKRTSMRGGQIVESLRREAKSTAYDCYHQTWEEAHAYLLERADLKLIRARIALRNAEDVMAELKSMTKASWEAA